MGIPYPEEYGGGGADSLSYAIAIEELARVVGRYHRGGHTSLGTWPLYAFGSEEQKADWMPLLCSGERLGAFGLTEPEAGSDAGNVRTRRARGRRVDDQRRQAVHHQQRHRHQRLRDDHGAHRRRGDLEPARPQRHARLRDRRALPQDGLERL